MYSVSLAIRDMQIKMTLRFHLTLIRMAKIKKTTNKCMQKCVCVEGGLNPHSLLGELQTDVTPLEINMENSQNTKNKSI